MKKIIAATFLTTMLVACGGASSGEPTIATDETQTTSTDTTETGSGPSDPAPPPTQSP
ncbi:MAG: hypothetical protein IPK60_17595 [Sandaracinaceae bacterium]|jgi:hypothetical protein|nr:hypothetical protein [Sandaracinaceae bacterium]